jgi:serine/threonine-protein kinase
MENQLFSGKYEIQGEIARGGMGIVYKAVHKSLNRTVALKVLHAQYTGDASFVKRFQREARAMARLDHENIIRVYDVSEDQSAQYIVMEYFPGKDLKQVILERGPLSTPQALSVALQMAEALAYAHAQGIVHRDIKPSNVMVDNRGKVKLADFGIAAATDEISVTATGQIIGTPEYMSPEQARGEAMDGRSDLYSLGIVLYEMLTGATPFERLSRMSIIAKLIYEPQEFSLTFPDHVSSPLQAIVQALLRKQAQDRTADAATLIEQIRNLGNESFDEDTLDRTVTRAVPLRSDATPAPVQPVEEEESTAMLPSRTDRPKSGAFSSPKTPPPLQRPATGKFTPVPLAESLSPEKTEKTDTLSPSPSSGQTDAGQGRRWVPIFAGVIGVVVLISGGVYFFSSSDSESPPQSTASISPPAPRPAEQPIASPPPTPVATTSAPPEPKKEEAVDPALAKVNEIEAEARKAQSAAADSHFEADRLDARHRASQLYLQAADFERKGAKAFQEGSELMSQKQYEQAAATLGESREFFVRADQGFKKAREDAQTQLAKAAPPSPKPVKKEPQTIQKTSVEDPAKASSPSSSDTGMKMAKQTPPPTAAVPPRPDIEVVGEILSKLKKAYEGRDMVALMQMSNLSDGRTRILEEIFRDFPVVKVSIANFSLAGELASANVVITKLVDKDGKVVSLPDEWKQSKVLIRKEGNSWGKVLW